MAGRFLNRWWRRSSPTPQVAEALAELAKLAADRPALTEPAALLAKLLPILFASPSHRMPVEVPAERAQAKLAAGLPLLQGETLLLDSAELQSRFIRIAQVVARAPNDEAAKAMSEAVRRQRLAPAEMLQHVIAGRPGALAESPASSAVDAGLLATVLRLSALPMLAAVQQQLRAMWSAARWEQGLCPVCGQAPLLGEFRGLEQIRFLCCGWCATDWEVPRSFCPFCGNRDHRRLGSVQREGDDRCRASTCDLCGGHVKMLTTLAALSPPQLLVADLASLHLDLALSNPA